MSRIIDLADALATSLTEASFSLGFTANRAYRATFDLRELVDLKVSVVPKGVEITPMDRVQNRRDILIDVGVQKKLTGVTQADMDPLMDLVEEIEAHVQSTRLFNGSTAVWIATENTPIYSQEHLSDSRLFTSVLTFTFRTVG